MSPVFRFGPIRSMRTYWVDLKRGAIPLQIRHEFREKNRKVQLNNDDLRPASGAGWIPFRLTMFVDSPNLFRQVTIRDMKVDRLPSSSTFQLDFEKPIPMVDAGRKLVYKPRASWSLTDLPSVHSGQAKKIEITEYEPPAPAMPGVRTAWSAWSATLMLLGVVLFIIMLLRISIAIKQRR